MLGNIKFIGQLYKKALLKEKIMRFCIASLLKLETVNDSVKLPVYKDSGDSDMDEEDHEAICNMFSTIGSTIDRGPAADFMKVSFHKINRLSSEEALPSRSRFMYKDLLDLRSNNWVPRRKVEKAKTLEEIRKDVEREERLQAQQSQQNNYRGGGRRDNYGGRDSKPRNTFSTSNRSRQPKPIMHTDDDGFTTIVGVGGAKSRPTVQAAVPSQRSSSQKSNSKSNKKSPPVALAEESTASSKKGPEALSPEMLERRVKSIRGEYIQDPSNMAELMLSVDELSGTPGAGTKFVQMNSDRIVDCKDDERAAIYAMVSILVDKGKISSSDVKAGLVDLIEFIDSLVIDAPKAFDYLGEMLTAMYNIKAIDIAWICEQAEKTKVSSEDNPEKIIRALAGAMESNSGKDGVRAALSGGPVAKLLGDNWDVVSKDIL
jgi:translation initiation factor 4G